MSAMSASFRFRAEGTTAPRKGSIREAYGRHKGRIKIVEHQAMLQCSARIGAQPPPESLTINLAANLVNKALS